MLKHALYLAAILLVGAIPMRAVAADREDGITGVALGTSLYDRLRAEPGDVLISPTSLLGALGVVASGARGTTRPALLRALQLRDAPDLDAQLGRRLTRLERSGGGTILRVANALWVQQDFAVRPEFIDTARQDYGASVDRVDFRNAGIAAAKRVNDWVSERTDGRITQIFSADAIKPCTRLIVTNAVYFLGDWHSPFPVRLTAPQPFYQSGGSTRTIPLMHQESRFAYLETDSFQAIDLPYKDVRLSMTILLPKARDALSALEAELDRGLPGWLTRLDEQEPRTVKTYLPKLQMELDYDLEPPLTAMGMGIAFTDQANLGGIAAEPLMIDKVVHKTFLRMDEKGTEAAAATGVSIIPASPPPVPIATFRADHPFLFLIRDHETGMLLFLGRVAAPTAAPTAASGAMQRLDVGRFGN
jgi:serpin B